MAYTQAQLVAAYTAANNGVAPDAATTALLGAFAAQNAAGQLSDQALLAYVINSAQDDVQVALQAYQFFTGKIPTKAGLDFLTNSAANTTDLNDPYYAQFNLENRYINFAANLGINGEGATAFSTTYGALSFAQFVGVVYEQIIGSSYAQAAGINVSAAIADIISRQANFTNTALARGIITNASTAAQRDLATKAAVVGYLMAEGVKADVGLYAAGANNFVNALIAGNAQFNVNMLTVYSPLGGGTGSATGSGGTGTGGTLTSRPETLTGNVFNAPQDYNPGGTDLVNTLQNDDTLIGIGTDPTLNVTLGNVGDNGATTITPQLRGVEVINARFDSTNATMTLDLQDAQGNGLNTAPDTINITRIATGVGANVINIPESVATTLSVTNSQAPSAAVLFTYLTQALSGTNNVGTVTLSNVNIGTLRIEENGAQPVTEGFETLTVNSVGSANKVGVLQAEDVQTLNVTGTTNLTLGTTATTTGAQGVEATRYAAGLANVAGSLSKIDASAFKGNLDITLGAEFNAGKDDTSGVNIQLSVIGGDGNDTFRLTDAVIAGATGNTDTINGGAGTNTVVVIGNTTIAAGGTTAAPVANVTNIQGLQIRSGHDIDTTADTVSINADAFDKLATIFVRNEGQDNSGAGGAFVSKAEGLQVNLTNLTSAQMNAITVAHGTTGNSALANTTIISALKTATGTADTATVTIVDGINNDPVFNFSFTATGVEKIALVDSDTESNSVFLAPSTFGTASATVAAQAGSSITLTGGAAGQYLNLDTANATSAAGASGAYGYATNGAVGSSTTVAVAAGAIAGVPAATSTTARDNAVSSVLYGNGQNGTTAGVRYTGENLVAGAYLGDVIIRLGDVTKADGVSSMSLTTGVGNDTFVFDNLVSTNAGFTSGDTITAGTGTDTLVLDGDTTGIAGTPRIDTQTSEWDNLKGIDVLRFANNAAVANVGNGAVVANTGGGYYAAIDNDFISQTDAGNRLTIVNNDGVLNQSTESDVVVDLRGLSQTKFVTFVGANGVGGTHASSRIVVDDISANSNMILDGGDIDVRTQTTGGYVVGNNNAYEVRNTANVSINDLSQTKNFGLINFSNDAAVNQTLTLTLNNTNIEALVDASATATTAGTAETLVITATDNGAVASILNVDARQLSGFHAINATGSNVVGGNDVFNLATNVGGAANTIAGGVNSTADRVNWYGTVDSFVITPTTNAFTTGATTTTHNVTSVEFIDLSNVTVGAAGGTVTGGAGNQTIIGTAGNDIITGGAGNDSITTGAGNDQIRFDSTDGTDTVTDFAGAGGADKIGFADPSAGAWNAAGTAPGAGTFVALAAGDYQQARANVAAIAAGDTNFVIELQTAQTTANLSTGTGGAANAYVVAFNSDTSVMEIWYDADWSSAAGRTQIASFTNQTTLVGVTNLTAADFIVYA